MASAAGLFARDAVKPKLGRDDIIARLALAGLVLWLTVFMALPLWALLMALSQR